MKRVNCLFGASNMLRDDVLKSRWELFQRAVKAQDLGVARLDQLHETIACVIGVPLQLPDKGDALSLLASITSIRSTRTASRRTRQMFIARRR